jgi:hypothetical protein
MACPLLPLLGLGSRVKDFRNAICKPRIFPHTANSKLFRWNGIALTLYACSIVGFCCSTSNGFDSSMFGNLLNNPTFQDFMSVGSVGLQAGIVSSMAQIGSVVAIPFVGPALDTW